MTCINPAPLWKILGFFLIFIFFLPIAAHPATDQQFLDNLLDGIEKKYTGTDFSADFVQQSHLDALDITEESSGKAYFSHPGKMRWEYHKPDVHQVITNGQKLWIYKPSDRQVIQGNAERLFKDGAGGGFLSDIGIMRKQFNVALKERTPQSARIQMKSTTSDPDIDRIVITVDRNTFEIRQVVTFNVYQDTTVFDFSNIRFTPLDEQMFEFMPPDGIDTIFMNEQTGESP